MCRSVACQVSRASAVGRQVDVHPLAVHGHPRQGHVVLPADQTAHLAEFRLHHRQRAAVALAPDQPFRRGRLELAMQAQQPPVGTEVEQGAVERAPREVAVPLDDADRQIGARLLGRLAERVGGRTGHVHGVVPVRLPGPSPLGAPAAHHGAEAEAPRIRGDERFGEQDQPRAPRRGLGGEAAGLLDGRLAVEEHRGGLHDGNSHDGRIIGHGCFLLVRPALRVSDGNREWSPTTALNWTRSDPAQSAPSPGLPSAFHKRSAARMHSARSRRWRRDAGTTLPVWRTSSTR